MHELINLHASEIYGQIGMMNFGDDLIGNEKYVVKQNESELADTVFKIQPNKANSFFCFLLFVQSFNCLYFWNQLPHLCGVFTKSIA